MKTMTPWETTMLGARARLRSKMRMIRAQVKTLMVRRKWRRERKCGLNKSRCSSREQQE